MVYEGVSMAIKHMVDGQSFKAEEIIPSNLVTRENAPRPIHAPIPA
jgi:hypothetical protein